MLRDSYQGTALAVPKRDRKSTRLNSSHMSISYAVFCLKKKKKKKTKRAEAERTSPNGRLHKQSARQEKTIRQGGVHTQNRQERRRGRLAHRWHSHARRG